MTYIELIPSLIALSSALILLTIYGLSIRLYRKNNISLEIAAKIRDILNSESSQAQKATTTAFAINMPWSMTAIMAATIAPSLMAMKSTTPVDLPGPGLMFFIQITVILVSGILSTILTANLLVAKSVLSQQKEQSVKENSDDSEIPVSQPFHGWLNDIVNDISGATSTDEKH